MTALQRAEQVSLDLVEVAPEAHPPVCKIMDYRRYTFEQKRREKESRKKAKAFEMKEIKLRPLIDPHDYGIKVRQIRTFLEKGHKVKVTMRYRARELRHQEIGQAVLRRVAVDLGDCSEMDEASVGKPIPRTQAIVLARKRK